MFAYPLYFLNRTTMGNVCRKVQRAVFSSCGKRKRVSLKLAKQVHALTQGHCYYCYRNLGNALKRRGRWEVEHQKAWSKGGRDDIFNLVPSCYDCNKGKGIMDAIEFCRLHGFHPRCRFIHMETQSLPVRKNSNKLKPQLTYRLCENQACLELGKLACLRHFPSVTMSDFS